MKRSSENFLLSWASILLRQTLGRLPEALRLLRRLEDDEPLSAQESANLEAAIEDIQGGRMVSLEEYER